MRLLEKSDLQKAKAADKAREIAEGLKISKKVDLLRQLKASEESALDKFRSETLEAIHTEISAAGTERDTLLAEVKALRKEKELGLSEIEERNEELDNKEDVLDEMNRRLNIMVDSAIAKDLKADANLKRADNVLASAKSHQEEAENLHRDALKDRADAKIELMVAQNTKEQISLEQQRITEELSARSTVLSEKEKSLNELHLVLQKERKAIDDDKRAIKDGYEALAKAREEILGRKT